MEGRSKEWVDLSELAQMEDELHRLEEEAGISALYHNTGYPDFLGMAAAVMEDGGLRYGVPHGGH